jgi:transpeptidase family protein
MRRVACLVRVWLGLAVCVACWSSLGEVAVCAAADAPTLYEQSMSALLERHVTAEGVSYLLVDVRTGRLLGARWNDPRRPVPMGSLVKPFTALAYAEAHGFHYPEYDCRGEADGCWLPRGHGRIGIEQAIAHSCNVYFTRLAAHVDPDQVGRLARTYGLTHGPDLIDRRALIGLGDDWRVAPVEIAAAYCAIVSHARDPGVTELVSGMALSAEAGTGRAVTTPLRGTPPPVPRVLVKTGTAPCVHSRKAPGDGYAVVLWPAEFPRYALLAGVHGVPGSRAAAVCGEMLRAIRAGE